MWISVEVSVESRQRPINQNRKDGLEQVFAQNLRERSAKDAQLPKALSDYNIPINENFMTMNV